ncbi:MAG TPA: Fic family protein [Chthoniobacteraceae bacterium]|nr:Fic family protein [Chthoniobacteraceae bacterium]
MKRHRFSKPVTVFHDLLLPEKPLRLVGYAALMAHYELDAPLPWKLSAVSLKHRKYETERWQVFTPKHLPPDTLAGHLVFALKHEPVDLGVLSKLFSRIDGQEIEEIVRQEPTGQYSRRIWFFHEWLTGRMLDLPDAKAGAYVDALNPVFQYPGPASSSRRHRVRNNLPGVQGFCPLVRRTECLDRLMTMDLAKKAHDVIGKIHPDIILRAAAFLLLKDSKASYAIEGETPPRNRAERWSRAIGQAGQHELTPDELLRLQKIVIEDTRFIKMGWRDEGGFIGTHDRMTATPLPDHISARWEDLPTLMNGLLETNRKLSASGYDPILSAALIAFGFVFIHPFVDGNGRIHRYLIHHVMASAGFTPKGIVFPISAVILERLDEYRKILEACSKPRLPLIEWRATERNNVEVLNETLDLYRFFDATPQAEFLYKCVRETIESSLPEEVAYLTRHDRMKKWISDHFEMPDRMGELLISFLRQGKGKLSKRALEKEFAALNEDEINRIERAYKETF